MSAAGYQDKLLVFCEGDPAEGDRMYLPDFPLASTYILKPEPFDRREHMVANEHYCMALARALKLPAARTSILRTPRPVLAVARFDRRIRRTSQYPLVLRSHIVDACQALDAPVSYKYERNIGSEQATRLYRDGVSLPRLFSLMDCSVTPAAHKLELVRWLLFQLTIGNSDAHGKNISFGMVQNRLTPAPWYDLVSVVQYPVSHELSMAVGDQFELDNLTAFDIGYFAHVCKVPATVLVREADRLVKGVQKHAAQVVADEPFEEDERGFVQHIADFALQQAARLAGLTREAAKLTTDIY
jgi:serine/threonine-protein kinase HipA